MDFTNSFSIRAPLPVVWEYLLDARKVTPCVPGAEITDELSPTQFRGHVKVKLGPVSANYRGQVDIEADEPSRTILLIAKGSEIRGIGGASGRITTTLLESADGTDVHVQSHLDVTGRMAQFGRGIIPDVAARMIDQFAACLETRLHEHMASTTS